jgi:activator of HSP90 ATPase
MRDRFNLHTPRSTVSRRTAFKGLVTTMGGIAAGASGLKAQGIEDVSHAAESIHQEISFKAEPQRVYAALTETPQFSKVVELSGALKSMALGSTPTAINNEVGGTFVLFGGHIVGRQLELVPGERIVQAWRVVDWEPGVYSVARFVLTSEGKGTRVVFDHTGFPKGLGQHLADGWRRNYWEPLTKLFA